MPTPPLCTAVIASPYASAAGMFSILDILSSVGRDWELLQGRPPSPPVFAPVLVSETGERFRGLNGVEISPQATFADIGRPDVVIVPDLHLDPHQPFPNDFAAPVRWIADAYNKGAIVASVCSGALMLAETGVLNGQEATTHWGYCDHLARKHPEIRVRRDRVLVPSGEGHRVITAGGASSWHDLVLYLVGRFAGPEEARRIAKLYLLQWHSDGQLPYAALTAGRSAEDGVIGDCQVWLADNYDDPRPVAAMVARSGVSERNFLRRFRAATGMSPRDYIQNLRVEEAKHLLETTAMPVDEVAEEVGYADPAGFRAAFRRRVGLTPSAYRRQFSAPATAGTH